jgi:hypothetical protein
MITLAPFQPSDQAEAKALILSGLVERAGLRQITLETTATWREVIAFYLNFGFHITHAKDGDVYFALDLP